MQKSIGSLHSVGQLGEAEKEMCAKGCNSQSTMLY